MIDLIERLRQMGGATLLPHESAPLLDEAASEIASLRAVIAEAREAMEIIAGKRQCIDNLMGNGDVAEFALARIAALSPLPPGSRVVVVPPEGSPEWHALVEAACEAYFDGDGYQWDEAKGADHVRASMRAAITAALRVLTGGGD